MSNIMFQTEIKFITDFTLNNVKKLGAFFTFERLLETSIHPAIKQYLSAEFEYLIYEDRQKLLQGSLFDYSGAKINHHFAMISEEIKKTKKVSFEDIKILVSRAVSFNVSYVLKPNWSLQKLVYGEKKSISVGELEIVLNYAYFYDYIKNVFRSYLSKRNIINVSSTEFELILNKIDRELFSVHFEKLVDNSIASIADLFSIGGLNKRTLSAEAVEIFLKEKNLIDHLLKLKRAIPDPGRKKYDIDDIRRIIFSATPVEPESVSPAIDEGQSEIEGEFEKVKTLEEAAIKPLTQNEEIVDEELSDENIIQELIQDEIVKHDIEELVEDETPAVQEDSDDEQDIFDSEEMVTEIEEIQKSVVEPAKNIPDPKENTEEEIIIPEVEVEDQPDKSSDEKLDELLSEADDKIENTEILSDKEEEDLFAFYDDELKAIDELTEDDEIVNLDELESSIDSDSEVEPIQAGLKHDVDDKLIDKVEIEKEEITEPEPPTEKIEIKTSFEENLPEFISKKSRDIFSFLTSKEIDKITDAIFNSDSEDFANTIERISECENYNNATEILKALFTSSKISPQSKQAVLLTNAVANYFDQV